MLYHLVKKDMILVKRYLLALAIFAVVGPIFITSKVGISNGSFVSFLLTVLFTEFILFNPISMMEEKYRGSALLCTTPHTRNGVIKAKYFFILVIFISSFVLYNLATVLGSSLELKRLSISEAGTALLILSVFFGILIPVQIKLGYEKTRYYFFFIIFLTPFAIPQVLKWFQASDVEFSFTLPVPHAVGMWIPLIVAFLIGWLSMNISVRIFSKKNL